jgi:chromosome partitioning protein
MGLMRLLPRPNERPDTDTREDLTRVEPIAPAMVTPVPAPADLAVPASTSSVRVIALANQKGGVAKTTTTLNLGVAFKEMGHRVLLIDLDPQGNLTMSQGMNPDSI